MNKNMKTICKEIQKGVNLDFNIPQYFNRLVTLYEQYAGIKFSMLYYTFYENYVEADKNRPKEEENLLKEMNQIIKENLLNDFSGEKMENGVKRLDAIRNNIISKMKILTAYTDIFQVYEYIFNRIEYKYEEKIDEIDEEAFVSEVISYIFDTNDNVIINEKIKEVIGQLPVRLSRSRYLDLIKDSLTIYKGGDRSSLDSYLYMIKTGAMLYEQEDMDTAYPHLYDLRKELEALDYKNLSKEEYLFYTGKIDGAAFFINASVDFYYGLQECVNHLYVMLILAPYAYMEGYRIEGLDGEMKFLLLPADEDNCKKLIQDINQHFMAEKMVPLEKESEEKLTYTEGQQELMTEEIQRLEAYFYDIKTEHVKMVESLMLGPLFHCLNTAQNLLGSSLFVELRQIMENKLVDEEYLLNAQNDLVLKLSELFRKNSQHVNRGVMANTINKMPVFFQSADDVTDYIKNTLEQCHDRAEKTACVNIIRSLYKN
ncbi:hypothetical protein [Anaerocolumna sp. MB42-C2]|uniref:hypothetical protein n=1 Tax=Anaerocolumna sp. MB42-C2 TaxID=3070997 RepID=UPI0027DF984D|nr:hypothetical protein [Anaerocolumna sp. MB42-C2]WMJ87908.1 hypothetical protein RBU59_28440 [Anaerocolumna sp. MB42-C2]